MQRHSPPRGIWSCWGEIRFKHDGCPHRAEKQQRFPIDLPSGFLPNRGGCESFVLLYSLEESSTPILPSKRCDLYTAAR